MHAFRCAVGLLLVVASAGGAWGEDISQDRLQAMAADIEMLKAGRTLNAEELRVFYKNGLRFRSDDGMIDTYVGGRLEPEYTALDGDADLERQVGDLETGARFRRVRFDMKGKLWKAFEYRVEVEFSEGDPRFRDVYLGLTNLPVGRLRIGHFKEPFGLEEIESAGAISLAERSVVRGVFTPIRNIGAMLYDQVDACVPMTWAVGVFMDDGNHVRGESYGDSNYAGTARMTATPIVENGGETLLHLGAALSLRNPMDGILRFRQRPEVDIAPRILDTGAIPVDCELRGGLEAAAVLGPLTLQTEIMMSDANGVRGSTDPFFWGWYALAAYMLTGEIRPYDSARGFFRPIVPIEPFLVDGGWGAWEIAARVTDLDLDEGRIQGGRMLNGSFGVNWHWNEMMRMRMNYVFSTVDSVGDLHAFIVRWEIRF